MTKALSFIRLDYITVKPYLTLKNLFIFSAVALIMILSSGTSVAAIAMLMVYAALYVSYPFAVCEKNGIDALYTTLSIERGTVVLGRYLFGLLVDICAGLLAFAFSYAVALIMQKDFNILEYLAVTIVVLMLVSIVQAVQLPIYFKLGYTKAKFLAYLPFIGLTLITLAAANFFKDGTSLSRIGAFVEWIAANPLPVVLLIVVIWLGIMVISYLTASSFYKKRDF